MTEALFFDTYAFFEILNGNPAYAKYVQCGIVTTDLNLFELYAGLLARDEEVLAKEELEKYAPFAVRFDTEIIEYAAKFRRLNRGKNFSMADCIGYIFARRECIKFLTGDRQFAGMPGVEFAK